MDTGTDVAVIRLSYHDAVIYWDELKSLLAMGLDSEQNADTTLVNLLQGIRDGYAELWLGYEGQTPRLAGVTSIFTDPFSLQRWLWIYTIAAWPNRELGRCGLKLWRTGVEALREYAHATHCKSIMGHTRSNALRRIIKAVDGTDDWRLIKLET